MLSFEKERRKDFLWLWSSKANVGGETGVKQNEKKISLRVCACVVRVGCGTPSQGFLGTREFETLTEPKFGVGYKEEV